MAALRTSARRCLACRASAFPSGRGGAPRTRSGRRGCFRRPDAPHRHPSPPARDGPSAAGHAPQPRGGALPPRAGPHATIRPQPRRNPALGQEEHASDAGSPAVGRKPVNAGRLDHGRRAGRTVRGRQEIKGWPCSAWSLPCPGAPSGGRARSGAHGDIVPRRAAPPGPALSPSGRAALGVRPPGPAAGAEEALRRRRRARVGGCETVGVVRRV